ncbi:MULTISPECIES: NCS2 family permease [Macellibacteroides]|jgi:AGZA family xanthine/uracil permease-like MFS transporter|uniref:AGZA family xanthine/uracil permease-like MFS transporter n=1 Tax=Macellibacteroides fermentans TaxID=879969 RepID=A0A8E2D3W8_9PORP|nr:NCS2 family permease [Macellibacteroides fermentans]MBP7919796.1 NCS2 family permease [Parabacteroides sp.]MBP8026624.1 NCS2 family permease [Parabacteroides sp.]MDD4433962.1 NCS2 family permease [Parabacteroides sp.]NYI48218.1 AGZA family xanthine/uracil permease-like MFS transporter [Macellibacteroides fermentans]
METSFFHKLVGFNPKTMKVRTEILAGVTTFLTMSYILAVNPDILSATGMDKGAVFTATALASAIATLLIAFLAKLPFAQAPGMGLNAFFAFTLVLGMGYSWQTALAAVFAEGIIFIIITVLNIREKVVNCIPLNLRYAMSVGIGMFIAFIGLKNSGIIVDNPATLVALGSFTNVSLVAVIGIILSGVLMAKGVKGALFYTILICTAIGIPMGVTTLPENFSPISIPPSMEPTFMHFDFKSLLNLDMFFIVMLLVFIDLFNTIGTLVGALAKTEMMDEKGNVPRMKEALLADAIGTSVGAVCGTSTVTTYVESAAGIAEGGRSGMTAAVTGGLFLVALLFAPVFLLVPSAATTGALVMVGVFMMDSIRKVEFDDVTETLPVFATILFMVLSYSIAEGMALGMMSYAILKLLTGRYKEVSITLYILTVLLILRYIYY